MRIEDRRIFPADTPRGERRGVEAALDLPAAENGTYGPSTRYG
ncbi:hypothetical protein OG830_35700 [Streptomyces sp. NBC_00121]|nr:hypothetical protein [Streptomyces sp. NBC_01760]WSC73516.1 hypothetical protein OG807_36370 [Streptomyces sp. NBC_01760]